VRVNSRKKQPGDIGKESLGGRGYNEGKGEFGRKSQTSTSVDDVTYWDRGEEERRERVLGDR